MKIACEVIRDLLPLYHDDVCSQESRVLVEAHLDQCEACKEELSQFDIEIKGVNNMEESKSIKNISQKWKKDKTNAFLKGVTAVSALGAFLSIVLFNVNGSYVDENGYLIESFGYIPLAYLFALVALISGLSLLVGKGLSKRKK